MILNCLIVDDEPIAIQIVEKYCSFLPELNVVETCENALQAKTAVQNNNIEIIFLDIDMPILDGISFIKTLRNPPQVIFTTAYKEYAHEAFDITACDYLLKPFSLERFIIAVDKAKEKLEFNKASDGGIRSYESFTYIKFDNKIYKIVFDELLYAEAKGNNVRIVSDSGEILPTMTFSNMEELLPASEFIRVHRSFIVNKNKIDQIEGNQVIIGANKIPIGQKYRDTFFREIGLIK